MDDPFAYNSNRTSACHSFLGGRQMKIELGKHLRELRRKNGNTQEQLANHLGVSVQAVSKWERAEGYPDISLLPVIASFYNVTVDELLGVGEAERKKRLAEYCEMGRILRQQGKTSERVKLWRDAQREFPNSTTVWHNLSFALQEEDPVINREEIVSLARRLLTESTQSGEYFGAVRNLCFASHCQGNMEEAKRYASMAGRYVGTENQLMIHILDGEEAVAFCQWNIASLVDLIADNVRVMMEKGDFNLSEQIQAAEFVLRIYACVYADGNYGYYHRRISKWNMCLAVAYAKIGETEKMFTNLSSAADHARAFDSLLPGKYTAFPVNRRKYEASGFEPSQSGERLKETEDPVFDSVREDSRFCEILNRLIS